EGDAAEAEQEAADEGQEAADALLVVAGLLVRGLHLGRARHDGAQLAGELLLGDALLRRDRDRGVAVEVEQLLCGRDREDAERRAAERLDVAVLRDADDLEPPRR